MFRKLVSHAAIYGLAAQVPRLAGVLALPIITRYLTPLDYGVAGVVTAYVSVFAMLQSLGLSVVMMNIYNRNPLRYSWVWRQLNGFASLWSVVYGLAVVLLLYFAVPDEADADRLVIALLCGLPIMFFSMTEMQFGLHYQLSQRPLPLAVRSFIVGVLTVAINIYTIAYLKLGYLGWFYSMFISAAIGFLINAWVIYFRLKLWPIFNFKWYRIRQSLRVSLPLVPHHAAIFLLDTSDRLVMDVLRVPLQRIGLYNVAASFGAYFMAATHAVTQAASPMYLACFSKEDDLDAARQVRRLTFGMLVLFLLATTIASLWMREIFELLIKNDELQQAYPLAIIILMGYNFRPMYMVASNLLFYHEKTRQLWRISGVAGVGNVVLNFMFIPVFGYQAAAFTTFASLMYMGYAGLYLKDFREKAMLPYYPVLWLGLTVLLLVIVYYMAALAVVAKVIVTAIVAVVAVASGFWYKRNYKL